MAMTVVHGAASSATRAASAARRLQDAFAAARVSFTWLGVRRSLSPEQKEQAAERFGATGCYLSAAKRLVDTRHPAYKAVTAVRGRAVSYWKGVSLPYPEPGIRLIRQDDVEPFDRRMRQLGDELSEAVGHLGRRYGELKDLARERLGRLYDGRDYPPSLSGLFSIQWDFPSVQPPDYLLQLNPALYEQEQARIAGRFEEAVRLAEEAFAAEFAKLVSHLTERLKGGPGGQAKVFRDSAVGNLQEFFSRFRQLNVRSNPQLDELVEQAKRAVAGAAPQELRDSENLRQQVGTQLSAVQVTLEGMLVDQPRRRILRPSAGAGRGEQT